MTIDYVDMPARPQAPQPSAPCREWALDGDAPVTQFHRSAAGHLIRFPGLADFEVSADARLVACHPVPGIDADTTAHLYSNQVRPLVLSQHGHLVIHASAVDIDGGAVAFAGATGRGKSTLAGALASIGHAVMADDGVLLRPDGDSLVAHPSDPAIRLWADSAAALAVPATPATAHRKRLVPAGPRVPFGAVARPLRRIYFLGDGAAGRPTCTPLTGAEALVAWVEHSFLLDLADRTVLAGHFDQVTALASMPLAFRLDFPRCFAQLPAVARWVAAHARGLVVAA